MLREYISGKIRENEEIAIELEGDIKKLQSERKELEKLIKIIEDENNDGSEIFSPRNHREQNLDKLKHYHEDMERISQETEDKLCKLSEAKKKKSEYESMLAEAEKNHLEDEKRYSNIEYLTGKQNRTSENDQNEDRKDGESASQAESPKERSGNIVSEEQEKQPSADKQDESYGSKRQIAEQSEDIQIREQVDGNTDDRQIKNDLELREDDQTDGHAGETKDNQAEDQKQFSAQPEEVQTDEQKEVVSERDDVKTEDQDQEERSENKEQIPGKVSMDTKRIIQKSIDEIVRRIEMGNTEYSDQGEPDQTGNSPQEYGIEQDDVSDIFEPNKTEKSQDKNNLDKIEIKSGELIVLESERRKEKEFLEKVKKGIDLCFVYSGNRNKCKNELRKVKRMIEDYISSIEV